MEMYRVKVQAHSKTGELEFEPLGEMNVYLHAKNVWRAQERGKNLFVKYEKEGATEDIDALQVEVTRQSSPVAIKPDQVYH